MNPLALLLPTVLLFVAGGAQDAAPAQECCFRNPNYQGVCRATPSEGKTCKDILEYLNTPNSSGKNFCNNTAIRGGWESVTCEKE